MKIHAICLIWLICDLVSGATSDQNDEQPNKSIVIFQETQQTDLNNEFDSIFSEIGQSQHISFNLKFVQLDRDRLDDSLNTLCSFLSSGVSLMIDITWDPAWPDLINLLRSLNIPYVHVDVSIRPYARAFFKFIEFTDTHDVAMIFQNEKEQYEGIYEVLNQYSIRSITFDGINETTAERIIKMRPMPSNFIIFARPSEMTTLFGNAIKFKVIERFNRWRLFYLDFVDTNIVQDLLMQYPEINSFTPSSDMCCIYLKKSVTETCICNGKITLLNSFIREIVTHLVPVLRTDNFKSYTLDCSVLTNGSSDLGTTSSSFSDPTEFESRLVEAVATSPLLQFYQNSTFRLEYFLKIMVFGRDGNELPVPTDESVVFTELAMIDNSAFSITPNVSLKSPRRFFRIGVAQAIPWSYVKMNPKSSTPLLDEQGNIQWEGYCIDFAKRLSEKLDFDYVLVPPTRGSFGDRVPGLNNTWDGLVGDLVTGDIDIAVAPMKMTAEREEVIDFVAPYFEQTGILIVIRKPVRQTSLFKFMTVLRVEVWLSIVGAIITTSIMLWLLDKYSPYSAKNNKEFYPYPCREFTFKESLWFSMTSFTPQGGGEAPKSLSSRTLVAAYWLFVVLMLATFTANLAAFLTVERMQTPVQSLDQLARQSRINYTVVEGSDTHKYFINMKFAEDTLYRMWKEIVLNSTSDQTQYRVWDYPIKEQYGHILLAINSSNPVANGTQGFQNVKDHINADYAFIHDSAEVKYEISRSCELIEVGEVFAEQPYALAIQQGSQLQDELSRAILELQKDRFFEALTAKYWNHSSKASECPNNDESEGITLESLGGVFIATLFGLALAMVTLVIEVVYYKRRDARENAVQPISGVTPPPSYDAQTVNRSSKKLFRHNNENVVTLGGEKFVPASLSQRVSYIPPYRRRSIRSTEENEYIE